MLVVIHASRRPTQRTTAIVEAWKIRPSCHSKAYYCPRVLLRGTRAYRIDTRSITYALLSAVLSLSRPPHTSQATHLANNRARPFSAMYAPGYGYPSTFNNAAPPPNQQSNPVQYQHQLQQQPGPVSGQPAQQEQKQHIMYNPNQYAMPGGQGAPGSFPGQANPGMMPGAGPAGMMQNTAMQQMPPNGQSESPVLPLPSCLPTPIHDSVTSCPALHAARSRPSLALRLGALCPTAFPLRTLRLRRRRRDPSPPCLNTRVYRVRHWPGLRSSRPHA